MNKPAEAMLEAYQSPTNTINLEPGELGHIQRLIIQVPQGVVFEGSWVVHGEAKQRVRLN